MENKNLVPAGILIWLICGIIFFIFLACTFAMGVWVGRGQSEFSYKWAENYHKNFGPVRGMGGHGIFGSIIKVEVSGNSNILTIKAQNGAETAIITTERTIVLAGPQQLNVSDLKDGQIITVIGSPNQQGQIEAKLIRIFPGKI